MAVKVCINGQMKKIDTALHKPVIFLNGQKKVLSKAWTFVNGEKKMLWGQPGIQVDLISNDGILTGINNIVAIGENWAVMDNQTGLVSRIDISNLSSPSLIQSVSWGVNYGQSYYQSSAGEKVFYGYLSSPRTLNKLGIDYSDGVVSVKKSYTMANISTGGVIMGDIGNSSIQAERLSKYWAQPTSITREYGTRFYINGASAYSIGHQPSSVSDGNYGPRMSSAYFQDSATTWLIGCVGFGSYASQGGFWHATTSGTSKYHDSIGVDPIMLDGDNIVGRSYSPGEMNLVDKTSMAILYTSESFTNSDMDFKFVGRNGGYYYIIQYPKIAVQDGIVTLYLLDVDDLTTVYSQVLPTDPFGEYNGVSTFWNGCSTTLDITGSGFLGVAGSVNGKMRIVRFSELLN